MDKQKVYTYNMSIGFMGGGLLIFSKEPNVNELFEAAQQMIKSNPLFKNAKLKLVDNKIMFNNIKIDFIKGTNILFNLK